uniref:Uncharacterized protein n=1 Tax=Physcomitrium patens TaxID=3218 RepID=A0A2K1INF0_PHYPA|nr:hypothetical protein PHYPA_027125 [Physcomitrium patens]
MLPYVRRDMYRNGSDQCMALNEEAMIVVRYIPSSPSLLRVSSEVLKSLKEEVFVADHTGPHMENASCRPSRINTRDSDRPQFAELCAR